MAPKSRFIPLRFIGFDQRMFSGPDKPIAVNDEESAGHSLQGNVPAAMDFASVLCQPALQCGVEGLSSVRELSVTIESIDTLERRRHIFR